MPGALGRRTHRTSETLISNVQIAGGAADVVITCCCPAERGDR
jgi:hypothetical protein